MDEYIYDAPKDEKRIPGYARSRLGVVSIVIVIVIMTAVTIQLDQKMAEITDGQGMITSIGREEIAGITKVVGKAKVNDQEKK